MTVDTSKLSAEVANAVNLGTQAVALLNQLVAIIAATPPSSDPTTQAALDQMTATLSASDASLKAAITTDTPAPAPAPAPVTSGS